MTARCCGAARTKGGVYAVCGLSEGGSPIEDFLLDPPIQLPKGLDLAPQGVTLIERGSAHHCLDWVGKKFYPNVADFVEEVKVMGMSRRLPTSTEFSQLRRGSKQILVHPKAILAHPEQYRPVMPKGAPKRYACPQSIDVHEFGRLTDGGCPMCARLWWDDLVDADKPVDPDKPDSRCVIREMPWGEYQGHKRPEGAIPEYMPGMFAAFPITSLEIVRDPEGGAHEAAAEKAKDAGLDIEFVDE